MAALDQLGQRPAGVEVRLLATGLGTLCADAAEHSAALGLAPGIRLRLTHVSDLGSRGHL